MRRYGWRAAAPLAAVVVLAIGAAGAAGACPAALEQLVPDAPLRARLLDGGARLALTPEEPPALVPAVPSRDAVSEAIVPPPLARRIYGTELLRLFPQIGHPCDWVRLYDVMRAVSTMQGIQYYSNSRGRYRTLFKRSHVVAGPDDLAPLPDPVATSVPERSTLHLLQEDSTFGSNLFRAEYRFDGVSVAMRIRNVATMWWHVLPLVRAGNYRSLVLLAPTDRGLLVYAAAAIPAPDLPALRERGQVSLRNRVDAVERWLLEQLDASS